MTIFLDPTGQSTFGIGICARCSRKMLLAELSPDPNSPGLMVCREDLDDLDPYRLPTRQTEDITLPFTRPDVPLDGFSALQAGLLVLATEDITVAILTESGAYITLEAT